MRTPSFVGRTIAMAAAWALIALVASATFALAKGEGAGIIRLAAPIPRDADPGSTLTVTFAVTIRDGNGGTTPVTGSPMVLKLVGPDGTTTEAMGAEHGTPGTYTATIKVPASGIESAFFGLRGTGTLPDGTTAIQDIPFDVDGLVFTTTAHAAPAAPASSPASPVDTRLPVVGGLGLLLGAVGLALALIGRRRALRSA